MATAAELHAAQTRAIIEQVKENFNLGFGQRRGQHKCQCMRYYRTRGEQRCHYPGTQVRVWANQTAYFCKGCVEIWDDVVTKALTGDWGDDDAIQEQSTTEKVPRRSQAEEARTQVGRGNKED